MSAGGAGGAFGSCDAAFVARLARALPAGCLVEPGPAWLTEPRGRWQGRAGVVARPRSTEEVATILRLCHAARVAVVPYGGGTGLVGGQVMPGEEGGALPLVLSLGRMRKVRGFWPDENVIEVEAGMTLAALHEVTGSRGRLFPLSLASEGTATIGGNLATNAGGTAVLRYGTARDLCLGIEAVLADGRVLHGLKRLRKDNRGYALRHLFIGSEGTLGVITAAALRLFLPPVAHGVALFVVRSPAAAREVLALAEERIGGTVSGFELISGVGLGFLLESGLREHLPFATPPAWCVLIDLGLPAGLAPEKAMTDIFAEAQERGLVSDGVSARSNAQAEELWALRRAIPSANRRIGAIASHDIALPLGVIAGFITEARARIEALGPFRINCFGHLGDGNLHYNVFPPPGHARAEHDAMRPVITRVVHDLVRARGGSISAEHGIGRLKAGELARHEEPVRMQMMRGIKDALDPKGIMNPGALLSVRQGRFDRAPAGRAQEHAPGSGLWPTAR